MAIVRYNPWSEMNSLQRQLNRMFDDVLTPATLADFGNFSKVPAAELTENEENLVLKLEVPGMQPADLNIEATAKSISISGERKSETQAEDSGKTRLSEGVYHKGISEGVSFRTTSFRTEFRYGSFQRVIPLPVRIQNTEVKAEYKNGILHLTLPKAEAEKNKVVKVNLLDEVDAQ
jgi:HSP20 family protein